MSFVLDPKDQVDGLSIFMIAGAVVQRGEVLYTMATRRVAPADASASATMPAMGIALNNAAIGRKVKVLRRGIIIGLNWTWNPGADLFVSTAPGAITQTIPTPPDIPQQIGVADSATRIDFNPQTASDAMITGGIGEYTYFVTRDNGTYSVFDEWGTLAHGPGADADTEINWALTNGGAGAVIALEPDTIFPINNPIAFTANNQWLRGGGRGTLIDGDALVTTDHGIELSGYNDCLISDLTIQTEGTGEKTCHCIFIEDGADRFKIWNVWIIDSDDDGIHIEGTEIDTGLIKDVIITDADGDGISVDMDGGSLISRLTITNCVITGVGDTAGDGIFFGASTGSFNCHIEGNLIYSNFGGDGISVTDFDNGLIEGNNVLSNTGHGIHVNDSVSVRVVDNFSDGNAYHGIYFETTNHSLIANNLCYGNDATNSATYDGINTNAASVENTIEGNECTGNHRYGIAVLGPRNKVTDNESWENDREGIYIANVEVQVNDNYVADNGQDGAGTYHGIYLTASADRCQVVDNYMDGFGDSQEDGVHLADGASSILIEGNWCYDGMGSGIALTANNDNCSIVGNYLMENDDYGIEITAATCNDTLVKENYFNGNVTGVFLDSGTDTRLATKVFPFIAGGDVEGTAIWASFVSATASAKGWSVAGADDWAVALGQLPQELQQIVRIKIWAVALGAPIAGGGQMHLEIVINAGADDLAFTTEPVALANFDSVTTDYVNTDVVHWSMDSGDDADIGHMTAGMSIEFKVIYETGADPDGATNAVFRTVEVEYV